MRTFHFLFFLSLILLLNSCRSFTDTAKYDLNSGYYRAKTIRQNNIPMYVYVQEDTLMAFPVIREKGQRLVDTSRYSRRAFPEITQESPPRKFILKAFSYDLDILAIPFKYRPPEANVPRQLTTQFNGALYTGFRTDRFRISYDKAPIGRYSRDINHYGYSIGILTGIGTESITPWVTRDQVQIEYDGVVWLNGIGAIIGINNFTFGMAIGVDYLLDHNRQVWIYQTEPWLGLTLGLNLN